MNKAPHRILTSLLCIFIMTPTLLEIAMGHSISLQEEGSIQEPTQEVVGEASTEQQANNLIQKFDDVWNDPESTAREKRVIRSKTTKALIELEESADTPEQSIRILRWIKNYNSKNRKGRNAAALILEKHFDQPGIGDCMDVDTPFEDILKVLESNQDVETLAIARFLQAQHYSLDDATKESILLTLLDDHPAVQYRGEPLRRQLVPLLQAMRFSVGKMAPEITGPDIDGVEFSLSDYRGKIVVLDFWGDW